MRGDGDSSYGSSRHFLPAKRVREDDFYSHPAPEKPYPDWCPLKTPGRVFMDSSLVAVEQAKPIDRTVEK